MVQSLRESDVAAPALVGRVHSWELTTGADGPGTRLVVFLSGCALRCLYCHNPDTWRTADGTETPLEVLAARLARYAPLLTTAGGGLTVSGGEPLLQKGFTGALLHAAKELGLHTALDTSGYLGARAGDALLDDVDLVLLDIKCIDPERYRQLTRRPLEPTLRFAERLAARGQRVWLRYVLVPGLTDDPRDVEGLARYAAGMGNVERVEVLPYHRLGEWKYAELGLEYPLEGVEPPAPAAVEAARDAFRAHGLETV